MTPPHLHRPESFHLPDCGAQPHEVAGHQPQVNHACLLSSDPLESKRAGVEATRRGLLEGRRVIWMTNSPLAEEAIEELRGTEFPIDRHIAEQRFLMRSPEAALFRGDRFDRFRALSWVREEWERALGEGFPNLMIIHELTSVAMSGSGNARELASYETCLNVLLRRWPMEVICIFDRHEVPATFLLGCMDRHPIDIGPDLTPQANPFFLFRTEPGGTGVSDTVGERFRLLSELRGLREAASHTDVLAELEETREESRMLKEALRRANEAVAVTTANFSAGGPSILYVNSAFTDLTGYAESEVLGRSFRILLGPGTDTSVFERLGRRLRRGEEGKVEVTGYRKDGSEFIMSWEVFPIRDEDGRVRTFLSIHRDLTAKRVREEALKQADRDPLTGVYNRNLLMKRLGRAMKRRAGRGEFPFAILFIDMDGFKAVNDEKGHLAGDRLLVEVARRLERNVRPGDTVARFGGDEFVIFLELVDDPRDPTTVAERILRSMQDPIYVNTDTLHPRASIGIALSRTGYTDPNVVIQDADSAMYTAKKNGGGYQVHDEALMRDTLAVACARRDLRSALARGEFALAYQPFVDLVTGRIVGVEALLRWAHRERGVLAACDFLPVARNSGLMGPIGEWVLRHACEQLREWQDQLEPSTVPVMSVNLSEEEVASEDLVDTVRTILDTTRANPAFLQLEIEESAFSGDTPELPRVLQALRALGVRTCIDRFGRGHSSIAQLHRLPVDSLKMDRVFLTRRSGNGNGNGNGDGDGRVEGHRPPGAFHDSREGAVRSILNLARKLGMRVIADGVETPDQRAFLRRMACPYAQGFGVFEPAEAGRVEELLTLPDPSPFGGRLATRRPYRGRARAT